MDKQTPRPEDTTIDAAGEQRFLDLVRKAVNTPVPESLKEEEREYLANRKAKKTHETKAGD